ncbi:MAG TPA: hypothetical protein VMC84_09985 [Methanocella sp.]|uniref:hypothetical protein n=1 Tax=Methanocella sp. TaxID=2052833 RepID=UPI002CBB1884|nr:hypothetical protein [Methanocella sp.]HTY91494.1 hypothetical protein [Methanocella sp.]
MLVICSILSLAVDWINYGTGYRAGISLAVGGISCLLFLAEVVIAAGTGALAVKYARPLLNNLSNAALTAAAAGLVAGIIDGVVRIVIAFIRPLIMGGVYSSLTDYGVPSSMVGSMGSGMISCLCMPVWVIVVVILAAIGGALYASLVAKMP